MINNSGFHGKKKTQKSASSCPFYNPPFPISPTSPIIVLWLSASFSVPLPPSPTAGKISFHATGKTRPDPGGPKSPRREKFCDSRQTAKNKRQTGQKFNLPSLPSVQQSSQSCPKKRSGLTQRELATMVPTVERSRSMLNGFPSGDASAAKLFCRRRMSILVRKI